MTNLFLYTGIILIVTGAVIQVYGALKYWKASKAVPALSSYRETLREKFYRYRLTWWILFIIGFIMVFVASVV